MSEHHYIVVKREGYTPDGVRLSAMASANALLSARMWPLWSSTRNRKSISGGDRLAVYLSGDGGSRVVATARVSDVGQWTHQVARSYPLDLDGVPFVVLHLDQVGLLARPVAVKDRLKQLSFVNGASPKWGVAFMGGARAVNAADFAALTN